MCCRKAIVYAVSRDLGDDVVQDKIGTREGVARCPDEMNLPGDFLAFSVDVGPHDAGLRRVCRNLLNLRRLYPAVSRVK